MDIGIMTDIMVIFGLSIAVVYVFQRLAIPSIVGFIATGIIVGPHGLALIKGVENVETMAEVGIVALLFTIGLEFSFRHLFQMRRSVLLGGTLQVLLTVLAGFFIAKEAKLPTGDAIFIGFLLSLSSTAIVLKLFQERAEVDSPHGKAGLGILIFQDIVVVPMILFTPLLAGVVPTMAPSVTFLFLKVILIVGLIIAGAKWFVPYLLFQIAKTKNRELFMLVIIMLCLSVTWMTYSLGLSLALGAFIAGLIISESEYSHQAIEHIIPFRDIFTSFFFVSIGMLLDVGFFLTNAGLIIALVFAVLFLKSFLAGTAIALQGYPLRTFVLGGMALRQVGEFSFILAQTGIEYGILDANIYQYFLNVSIITMAITPFVMKASPRAANILLRSPIPKKLKAGSSLFHQQKRAGKRNHIIIVGFGINGRNVARVAKKSNIPYLIIDEQP